MTETRSVEEEVTAALNDLDVDEKAFEEKCLSKVGNPEGSEDEAKDGEEESSESSKPPNGVAQREGLPVFQRVVRSRSRMNIRSSGVGGLCVCPLDSSTSRWRNPSVSKRAIMLFSVNLNLRLACSVLVAVSTAWLCTVCPRKRSHGSHSS